MDTFPVRRPARHGHAESDAAGGAGRGDDGHGRPVAVGRPLRSIPLPERPRERLAARGPSGLSAAELIAVVWGSGVRGRSAVEVAGEALARHDGLAGLARASDVELEAIPGVGRVRAAQLAAAFELGRRLLVDGPTRGWTVRAPSDLADRLMLQMGGLEQEELRVVLLNAKNAVLRIVTVYVGNVSASLVRIGELFRDAVRANAAGLIIVHNHPSGDPTPSPDDLHLTSEALAAGRLLDIDVLDHLIIGRGAYVSLRNRGVAFDRSTTRVAEVGSGGAAPRAGPPGGSS
jgi:DNA repair protein RadC